MSPSVLYYALCLNKNLSTKIVLKLMIQIMNKSNNNRDIHGINSIEITKLIDTLASINYIDMTLEEVNKYFIPNSDNYITNDDDDNNYYKCDFNQVLDFDLEELLTITVTTVKNKINVYIYKNPNKVSNNEICLQATIDIN
jgi:hypothetical protein